MSDTTAVSPSCWHIHPIKYMSPSFKLIKTLVQLPTSFLVKITHGSKYEHVYAFNHTRVNISPHIKKSKLPISPPVSRSKGRETKATKDYQENLSNPNVKLALFISCKQPRLLFWMERQAIDLKKKQIASQADTYKFLLSFLQLMRDSGMEFHSLNRLQRKHPVTHYLPLASLSPQVAFNLCWASAFWIPEPFRILILPLTVAIDVSFKRTP